MLYCFRCSSWRRQLYPLLEAMHWHSHLQRNSIIWVKGWYKKGVRSLNWWNSLITSFGRLFIDSEGIKTLSSIAVSSFWRQSLCSNVSLEASWLPSLQTSSTFLHLVPCGSLFMREGGCPPWHHEWLALQPIQAEKQMQSGRFMEMVLFLEILL